MEKIIFEIKDKTGRKIRLTGKQWEHITIKHPDISGKEEEVKRVLEIPDLILPHKFDEKAGHYYKYDKKERAYIFVSAKYLNGEGFVITAFYTQNLKRK